MSSTFLQQVIAEHSSRHSELLNSLSQLDTVPETLKEQTRLVDELQSQLEECEANVARLFEKTRNQRRNADPGLISGGLKFSQVFRSRKEKEKEREREEQNKRLFAEAMAEETNERNRRASLEQALSNAQASKTELLNQMKEYDNIMAKIDALYALIFNGPTPGFPREDELEQAVQASLTVVERAKAGYNTENEALEILSRSERAFRECQTKMKDAIYWATALAMLAGGRTAEAKEGVALKSAHSLAQKAQAYVQEAQQYSTHVRTLDNPSIAREMPIRKENDTEFHETLKATAAELGNTYSQLVAERRACTERTANAKAAIHSAEQVVMERKSELHELRKELFLDTVSKLKSGELAEPTDLDFEGLQDAPPSYELQHPLSYSQSYSQSSSHSRPNSHTLSLGPLSTELAVKQDPRQMLNFGSPPYENAPSSPISHPYSSTPSASRSDSARPRTARRPLPRVPQANAG
ncbi:hypothetical protein GGU11DRAFT_802453 [Lentinula aff. detonsa]|nr:hypothetical protein GGU11DRAFT_802453 [Lentinula aff. detonsa]